MRLSSLDVFRHTHLVSETPWMSVALGMLHATGPLLLPFREARYIWNTAIMVITGRNDDRIELLLSSQTSVLCRELKSYPNTFNPMKVA